MAEGQHRQTHDERVDRASFRTLQRYTLGRYFSPLGPNRPRTVERLLADNDVVRSGRRQDRRWTSIAMP